jgi:hypothetical protein
MALSLTASVKTLSWLSLLTITYFFVNMSRTTFTTGF